MLKVTGIIDFKRLSLWYYLIKKILEMKAIFSIITILFCFNLTSFAQSEGVKLNNHQAYQEHSPLAHHHTALEVLKASKAWIDDFNKGNSQKCVDRYADNATMRAIPFGLKTDKTAISIFWQQFIESGASNLIYTNVKIEVVDEKTVFLSANWSMNVGRGVIYQEKWEKIDNKWFYTYDDFELLEEFETPRIKDTPATESHEVLKNVIEASIKWTNGFNNHESKICGNGYSKNATLNAVPFANVNDKDSIHKFWSKLIEDGGANLTYHNPIFEVITPTRVKLSATWSMNIGEGKIYQEKWIKENNVWVLGYDEFKVLKQY